MPNPLDWDDLRHFLAIVERGSISGAATLLKVNHSTVLRRIGALEDGLGQRLFDRLPGGYTLTAQGHALAEQLAGVRERIEAAQRQVQGGDTQLRGSVRLTTTDTLLHGLLLPVLAGFRTRHPEVQLEVTVDNSFLSLTQREADVAVRGTNQPPENLVGRRAGAIRTALYGAQRYLDALPPGAGPADWHWVALDESLAHLEQARRVRAQVDAARIALRLDTLVGMADAVAAGLGVGWLLCPLALQRPGLVELAPPAPEMDTGIWVLTHPDLKAVARVKALTDFLFDALSADARLRPPPR
jgi:DNA-binding transcriptional LysR family regulator